MIFKDQNIKKQRLFLMNVRILLFEYYVSVCITKMKKRQKEDCSSILICLSNNNIMCYFLFLILQMISILIILLTCLFTIAEYLSISEKVRVYYIYQRISIIHVIISDMMQDSVCCVNL